MLAILYVHISKKNTVIVTNIQKACRLLKRSIDIYSDLLHNWTQGFSNEVEWSQLLESQKIIHDTLKSYLLVLSHFCSGFLLENHDVITLNQPDPQRISMTVQSVEVAIAGVVLISKMIQNRVAFFGSLNSIMFCLLSAFLGGKVKAKKTKIRVRTAQLQISKNKSFSYSTVFMYFSSHACCTYLLVKLVLGLVWLVLEKKEKLNRVNIRFGTAKPNQGPQCLKRFLM